jgi:chemotaxis protein methyltransferase CheR
MNRAEPSAWSNPAFERVADVLAAHTGLAFGPSRVADAEAGIRRAMTRAGLGGPLEYLRHLEAGTARLDDLISELTVGETYFFREPWQFAAIRDEILPSLLRERPPGHLLRLWSAGCASGEEPYSLAILVAQAGLAARAHILATDISRTALARAAEATYGPWSLRGVDPEVIRQNFHPRDGRLEVDERIREPVHLDYLNLALDTYPSFANGTWRMDVILCRNVLIYLDTRTVHAVARRLADCLAPGGWLIAGPSDPPLDEPGLFDVVITPAGILYRAPAPARDPAAAPRPAALRGAGRDEATPPPTPARAPAARRPAPDPLAEAAIALHRGDYPRALELASGLGLGDPAAEALCIRALANGRDPGEAERRAAAATARHPTVVELQLLHAVLLIDLHRYDEAARAARRALYIDRGLTIGHFLLGAALVRLDDAEGALKAFRNARDLCARQAPDDSVRFADGQRAGRLGAAAAAQLELLAHQAAS